MLRSEGHNDESRWRNPESRAKSTLTRSFGAASPATERARRIIGGAERDILTPCCTRTLTLRQALRSSPLQGEGKKCQSGFAKPFLQGEGKKMRRETRNPSATLRAGSNP